MQCYVMRCLGWFHFSVDGLKEFATQFLNDELTPYVKSEPVPENNDGPVKVDHICYYAHSSTPVEY